MPHHVQLIAIAGAMGAGIFISIGGPLSTAGPLGLLIGVGIWCTAVYVSGSEYFAMDLAERQAYSNCLYEMASFLPVPGGFIYYTGRFLDKSAQFALGCKSSDVLRRFVG